MKHFLSTHNITSRADLEGHVMAHEAELLALRETLDAVSMLPSAPRNEQADHMLDTMRATIVEVQAALDELLEVRRQLYERDIDLPTLVGSSAGAGSAGR